VEIDLVSILDNIDTSNEILSMSEQQQEQQHDDQYYIQNGYEQLFIIMSRLLPRAVKEATRSINYPSASQSMIAEELLSTSGFSRQLIQIYKNITTDKYTTFSGTNLVLWNEYYDLINNFITNNSERDEEKEFDSNNLWADDPSMERNPQVVDKSCSMDKEKNITNDISNMEMKAGDSSKKRKIDDKVQKDESQKKKQRTLPRSTVIDDVEKEKININISIKKISKNKNNLEEVIVHTPTESTRKTRSQLIREVQSISPKQLSIPKQQQKEQESIIRVGEKRIVHTMTQRRKKSPKKNDNENENEKKKSFIPI
jgi:hypothetical protein